VKIGLVTPYLFPLPGGVNAHVGQLYEQLTTRGHEVRIISSKHGLQRPSEGDIIRIGRGFSIPSNGSRGTLTVSAHFLSQVRGVLLREQFDLLHFHEPFVPFLSPVLLRESTSVNIATFHAYGGFSPAYEFAERMLGGYARRLHGRIAVSAAARHFISRYFPGDYKVIPNGVDVAAFASAQPFERWRDGTPNLLFVGRFEARKGLMYLLRAYRILRRSGHHCRLLLVGTGPQLGEARRYVYTRRLTGVEFLGRVSDEDKMRWFATADIFVSPATGQESFGIVLLEAMAAGVPIVCSDIHGYKGVVKRGEQALLVPPSNAEVLAAAIGELLGDPERRARMAAAGRERARSFGWDQVAARVDEYYAFVIRRLAAQGRLPSGFHGDIPPVPHLAPAESG
jgi:phosphatidylinositol alpha-mannosyltransferase